MVEGDSAADYPLQKKRQLYGIFKNNLSFKTENKYFPGSIQSAFFNCLCYSSVFQEQGFVYVHTPLITGSDCEGAGEMFQVTTMDLNDIPKTEEGK